MNKPEYYPSKAVLVGDALLIFILFTGHLRFWGTFVVFEVFWFLQILDFLFWRAQQGGC